MVRELKSCNFVWFYVTVCCVPRVRRTLKTKLLCFSTGPTVHSEQCSADNVAQMQSMSPLCSYSIIQSCGYEVLMLKFLQQLEVDAQFKH